MLQTIGKTIGMAIAGMCLVSTLAIAQVPAPVPPPPLPGMPPASGTPMVCTKVDMRGNCVEAKTPDEKMVTVQGYGIKVGEKMTCVIAGPVTTCTKVTMRE